MIFKRILILLTLLTFFTSACGTRDYGSSDEERQPEPKIVTDKGDRIDDEKKVETYPNEFNQEEDTSSPRSRDGIGLWGGKEYEDDGYLFEHGDPHIGYLWDALDWIGVPDDTLESFKSNLADDPDTSEFTALGTAIFGGALLGLVIRASGSWFLGGPVESKSGHWFWNRMERASKAGSRGLIRGGLLSGACYAALVGLSPLPYQGILGDQFSAAASATCLGGAGAISSGALSKRIVGQDWSSRDTPIGKLFCKLKLNKPASQFEKWTRDSKLIQGARYRVIPGVIIIGVGTGLGLVVFNSLQ